MWTEASFCTVIVHSMNKGYKIPDESGFQYGVHTSIRCFDGLGMLPASIWGESEEKFKFICWEAKTLKGPGAFSFKKIRPWQDEYLTAYTQAENEKSLVILGVDYGRADKRVFVFEWDKNMSYLYSIGFSIHLKELNRLPYNKISKNIFTFDNIIKYDDIKALYTDFDKVCNTFKEKAEITKDGEGEL